MWKMESNFHESVILKHPVRTICKAEKSQVLLNFSEKCIKPTRDSFFAAECTRAACKVEFEGGHWVLF